MPVTVAVRECNCTHPIAVVSRGHHNFECDRILIERHARRVSKRLLASGWDVVYLEDPTLADILDAASAPCVEGLYLTGHGSEELLSTPEGDRPVCLDNKVGVRIQGTEIAESISFRTILEELRSRDHELSWFSSATCCQDGDELAEYYEGPILLPTPDSNGLVRNGQAERDLDLGRLTPDCREEVSPGTLTCPPGIDCWQVPDIPPSSICNPPTLAGGEDRV
ncbi:MAG: hypothetical protein R3E97_23885 [Candidatus Eisenbacteria bacterium]